MSSSRHYTRQRESCCSSYSLIDGQGKASYCVAMSMFAVASTAATVKPSLRCLASRASSSHLGFNALQYPQRGPPLQCVTPRQPGCRGGLAAVGTYKEMSQAPFLVLE